MAKTIKRIEKDFFLKALYDEQLPLIYLRNRTMYTLTLEKPIKGEVHLNAQEQIAGLYPRRKLELSFDIRGMMLKFSVEIISVKDTHIVTEEPEFLYKDLERSYSRVPATADLRARFEVSGGGYILSYPKISEFEDIDMENLDELIKRVDIKNLSGLLAQIAAWLKGFTDGYKMVLFQKVQPSTTEERLLAETGRILLLPSVLEAIPEGDPFPKKRLITAETFRRFMESTGIEPEQLDEAISTYLDAKKAAHICSEVYIPILFQGYVIGYLYAWSSQEGKKPFTYDVLETFYQFASVLAFSFKENGYFESGHIGNKPFEGKIIDISVSGILFAYPLGPLAEALGTDKELTVTLTVPDRTVSCSARIVRQYKDSIMTYCGCRFLDVQPEDLRFLFEYLYGRPFSESDAAFLAGHV
ncbi:MAG: PilZ domain-containing protein [Treponema sp.]|jgi:hypothetical protein|nr:PilZ domain-containing protein [Treponema sp.]